MPIIILSALIFVFLSSTAFTQERLDGVVAVVGNEIILQSELDAYSLLRMEGMGINKDSSDISQLRKSFLNELIDGKVLLAYAKKDSTIKVTEPEVDQMLNNHISMLLKQNHLTLEQLDAELQRQQGLTLSKFKSQARKAIKEQLYKQKIQQSYLSFIKVSRKDVESFYKQYIDSLPKAGESVLLSKISMKITPTNSKRQEAYDKIRTVKQLLDKGEDFAELAKKYSESPEAIQGGDLGFVAKGSLNELAFEEKAFNLTRGQISEPFETRLGFHIINVLDKQDQKVHIRQIFVKIEPDEQQIKHVNSTLDSLRINCKTKDDFSKAVHKFSADLESKNRDGSIGWFSLLELPAAVRIAVDTLASGSVTRIVNEENMYSIYRIDDRVKQRTLNLENDYGILSEKTRDIMAQKKLIDLVSQWKQELFIDIRL
jgi:peptidyl-prolyl cis-trans isomerase SurA